MRKIIPDFLHPGVFDHAESVFKVIFDLCATLMRDTVYAIKFFRVFDRILG